MSEVIIPQGEQTVTVELTVKEALALGGARFNQNPQLLLNARRKVAKAIDRKLLNGNSLAYEQTPYGFQ